jgi:hypothetical protein
MGNWEQALQGGVGGAMAGSAFGPPGTAVGGLLGVGLGLFGGGDPNQQYRDQMAEYARYVQGRETPMLGPASLGQLSGFRGNQADLVAMLEAQARGEGPSLAGQQLQAGMDRAGRQAQGMAAGARGPNAALGQFQAQQTMGDLGAQANQQAAMARIQEQYNAQNQLGLTLHGARGQDEAMSQFNAGQQNQFAMANQDATLRGWGLNDSAVLGALGGAGGMQRGAGLGESVYAGGANWLGFRLGQRANNQPQSSGFGGPGLFS